MFGGYSLGLLVRGGGDVRLKRRSFRVDCDNLATNRRNVCETFGNVTETFISLHSKSQRMNKCLNCKKDIPESSKAKYCSNKCRMIAFKNRQVADTVEVKITFKNSLVNDFRVNERYMTHQQIVDSLFEMYKWRGKKTVFVGEDSAPPPKKEVHSVSSTISIPATFSEPITEVPTMTTDQFRALNAERLRIGGDDYDAQEVFQQKVLSYRPSEMQRKNLIGY